MNYAKQRKLAARLFPFLDFQNEEECFEKILEKTKSYWEQILQIIGGMTEVPSECAYEWAREFPEDREVMRKHITDSEWAYKWARRFPEDREVMRKHVTDSGYV